MTEAIAADDLRTETAALSPDARFRGLLEDARRVHVDARVLAYHLLGDRRYLELLRLLFAGIRSGSIRGQTSALALYQLLVEPWRQGEGERAKELARHLTVFPGLEVRPVSAVIAAQAAQVRARLGGRLERAVHVATALETGADAYLTEGSGLRRIAGMSVLNLEDFAQA